VENHVYKRANVKMEIDLEKAVEVAEKYGLIWLKMV
jgi:hypothetical protein